MLYIGTHVQLCGFHSDETYIIYTFLYIAPIYKPNAKRTILPYRTAKLANTNAKSGCLLKTKSAIN